MRWLARMSVGTLVQVEVALDCRFFAQDGADPRIGIHPRLELEVGPGHVEGVVYERIGLWYDTFRGRCDFHAGSSNHVAHGDALLPLPLFRVVNNVAIPVGGPQLRFLV